MKRLMFAGLFAALAPPSAQAADLFGPSRLSVTPVANGFAVENDKSHGARGMWCAAGEFARASGRPAPETRIYVAEPRPLRLGARDPVVFTLDPAGLVPRGAFVPGLSLGQAGSSMSLAHALSLCYALQSSGR